MGIKKQNSKPNCISERHSNNCPDKVSISLKLLTTNKNYNFNYFSKNKDSKKEAKAAFYDKIELICNNTWVNLANEGKTNGLEYIGADQLKFSPKDYKLTQDQKVIVLRFNNQNYRIIGVKLSSCATLDIIGFDFDYSAYEHGS